MSKKVDFNISADINSDICTDKGLQELTNFLIECIAKKAEVTRLLQFSYDCKDTVSCCMKVRD